jgi:hypothetical protein
LPASAFFTSAMRGEIDVDADGFLGEQRGAVRVDEAGYDRAAAGIDALGGRAGERLDFAVGADCQQAVTAHGKRRRTRTRRVHGQDAGAGDNEVGGEAGSRSLRGGRPPRESRRERERGRCQEAAARGSVHRCHPVRLKS